MHVDQAFPLLVFFTTRKVGVFPIHLEPPNASAQGTWKEQPKRKRHRGSPWGQQQAPHISPGGLCPAEVVCGSEIVLGKKYPGRIENKQT